MVWRAGRLVCLCLWLNVFLMMQLIVHTASLCQGDYQCCSQHDITIRRSKCSHPQQNRSQPPARKQVAVPNTTQKLPSAATAPPSLIVTLPAAARAVIRPKRPNTLRTPKSSARRHRIMASVLLPLNPFCLLVMPDAKRHGMTGGTLIRSVLR